MSKIVTCVATLMLVEDGRLNLNDPPTKLLPELKISRSGSVHGGRAANRAAQNAHRGETSTHAHEWVSMTPPRQRRTNQIVESRESLERTGSDKLHHQGCRVAAQASTGREGMNFKYRHYEQDGWVIGLGCRASRKGFGGR